MWSINTSHILNKNKGIDQYNKDDKQRWKDDDNDEEEDDVSLTLMTREERLTFQDNPKPNFYRKIYKKNICEEKWWQSLRN